MTLKQCWKKCRGYKEKKSIPRSKVLCLRRTDISLRWTSPKYFADDLWTGYILNYFKYNPWCKRDKSIFHSDLSAYTVKADVILDILEYMFVVEDLLLVCVCVLPLITFVCATHIKLLYSPNRLKVISELSGVVIVASSHGFINTYLLSLSGNGTGIIWTH